MTKEVVISRKKGFLHVSEEHRNTIVNILLENDYIVKLNQVYSDDLYPDYEIMYKKADEK